MITEVSRRDYGETNLTVSAIVGGNEEVNGLIECKRTGIAIAVQMFDQQLYLEKVIRIMNGHKVFSVVSHKDQLSASETANNQTFERIDTCTIYFSVQSGKLL